MRCVLQIFIGFTQKILDSITHSYDNIVDELDENDMSKTCAAVILQALNQKGNEPLDWRGMDRYQREAAMELMVLTHVAEAAVPLKEEVCSLNTMSMHISLIKHRFLNFRLKECLARQAKGDSPARSRVASAALGKPLGLT